MMMFPFKTLVLLLIFVFKTNGNNSVLLKLFNQANEDSESKLITIENLLTILKAPEIGLTITKNFQRTNISAKCIEDFSSFSNGLLKGKDWALQMLDAFGKVGSGISQGNIIWPGRFSVCNDVVQGVAHGNNINPFRGRFCWVQISPNVQISQLVDKKFLKLRTSVCIPDTCSSNDLNKLLQLIATKFFSNHSAYVSVNSDCLPSNRNIWRDKRAVICLAFLFLITIIALSGTFYDVYLQLYSMSPQNSKKQSLSESEFQLDSKIYLKLPTTDENELAFKSETEKLLINIDINNIDNVPIGISIRKKLLLCFSLYSNSKQLFNCQPRDKSLMCLNGIRVLSMISILLGHTYLSALSLEDNMFTFFNWTKSSFWFLFFSAAMFSVDSFFVLSGLLVTFLYLKQNENRKKYILWLKFYFHQYWRLTPVYAVVIIIIANITSPYYSNGPFWPQNGLNDVHCDKYWWTHLLYINNFVTDSELCMSHTWYLATNMQFFIISPLILIFLKKSLPIVTAIVGCFILISWISSGTIATYYHVGFTLEERYNNENIFTYLYEKPYCRVDAYVIGMICGYLLHRHKCQAKLNKNIVVLGWLVSAGLSYIVCFGTFHSDPPQSIKSLYFALSRSTWSVALSWMIYACCNGYGGFLNNFLSWSLWQPLGRLSYSTYLIHRVIIHLFLNSSEVATHFSHSLMISTFFASVICSYFASIFLYLLFEEPFIVLEKLMLKKKCEFK